MSGSTLLSDEQRQWYEERFGERYVRVAQTPPQFGNRRQRRAAVRRARRGNDGRVKE